MSRTRKVWKDSYQSNEILNMPNERKERERVCVCVYMCVCVRERRGECALLNLIHTYSKTGKRSLILSPRLSPQSRFAEADIRLGDVVVSKPTGRFGGVVQYDFGKALANDKFALTGAFEQTPTSALDHACQDAS